MPKSKQRKNHKKKVESFKKRIQEKRKLMRDSYIKMLQDKQQEEINKRLKEQTDNIDIVDSSDVDVDVDDLPDMNK